MTPTERQNFKKLIDQELVKIKEKIDDLKELTKPISPDNAIGRVSRMDAINNKSMNDAALRTAEEKFKKLEYALSKVDDDDFGVCAKCKGDIPQGRLLLMPESRFCVRCASR